VIFQGDIARAGATDGDAAAVLDDLLPAAPSANLKDSGLSEDDSALMVRVGSGCNRAFGVLVDRHTRALYRVAARMLGDGHEAEDVVQECFIRLWQHAPRWQPSGAGLIGWLHKIAINLCFDRKRRFRVVTTPDLPEMADAAPMADALIESDQARSAVAKALASLPARYQAALVLCYYEGFSNALAADVLNLNIKAMESLLFRARRHLRELLSAGDVRPCDMAAGQAFAAQHASKGVRA